MESCADSNVGERELDTLQGDAAKRDPPSELSISAEAQRPSSEEQEHLQVFLRIRPFTAAERINGECQDCVTIDPPDTVLLRPPSLSLLPRLSVDKSLPQVGQHFQFSKVYGPETTQRELFQGTVRDLVKEVLQGGNSLVFTYGVTNAGKTFTFLGPEADAGLLPRSLDVIFSSIGERGFPGVGVKPQRCREFVKLSVEQQTEEALFKRTLLRQLKEVEKSNSSLLNATNKTLIEEWTSEEDKVALEAEPHVKFSVWVSFCEIYNENIHDLLEALPSGASRRTALRLSQDVKGNAFIKDLRWIQVNSAEEAFKVMKFGKKNQSFSSTRLNQLSSRSHSIFSIRILRIEDVGSPRVLAVSELSLCDLAGSERCAKTQNKGERLKEAGNINTSLLILGKCINALRHNQQAKLPQHVPFRESKLTHYLQGFFCGRGKACMIVNVNQCASMYDETLNVLKFSAVAQKVLVLPTRQLPSRTTLSERKTLDSDGNRRSSGIGWDSSLEDVLEDGDDGECDEGRSLMEVTADLTNLEGDEADENNEKVLVSRKAHQGQMALLRQLQLQLRRERAESALAEQRVRDEVSQECSKIFSQMQEDFDERLARQKEILEERAEKRLEIFKNLVDNLSAAGAGAAAAAAAAAAAVPACTNWEDNDVPACGAADRGGTMELLRVESALKQDGEAGVMEVSSQVDTEASRLQEALVALAKERRAREEALAALEYQTVGKEEAHVSLEEERRAKEEALASLEELRRSKEEVPASLLEERRAKEEALLSVEELRRSKEVVLASLSEERRAKEEALLSVEELRRSKEEVLASLAEERRAKVEVLDSAAEEQKEELRRLQEEKNQRQLQEADALRQEVEELRAKLEATEQQVSGESDRAEQALVQLRHAEEQLEERRQEIQHKNSTIEALTQEVHSLKNRVPEVDLTQAKEQEELSKRQAEELRQQKEASEGRMVELQSKLHLQERASREEVEELEAKFKDQTQTLEEMRLELGEKLRAQEVTSQQQLEDVKQKLSEEAAAALEQLRQQLRGQEDLQKINGGLQAEVASLREELAANKEKEEGEKSEEEEKSADLQRKVQDMETQLTSLQRSLKEAQEQREEEKSQAVQETRRLESERRRELLAVAHEAIAHKDEELEKRAEEISRLKESGQQEAEWAKSLSLDLQRKEEEASDLREKLADYKKQIQQVQKEISSMREEEKVLRQKLSDAEKAKKQLQSEVASRERSIQQLRTEQPADCKSAETAQLYQKACKELEAKERVMDDMRLALTEQEETQSQMEEALEEKLRLIQELSGEVEKLKGAFQQQDAVTCLASVQSEDFNSAKREAAQAQESLKLSLEKQQAERRKWLEEKLLLIGQAKEAEERRNQDMKRFAEDRERFTRQQSQLESLSTQLAEKDQKMESWRKERDTLVMALEVQLQKLLTSQADKDQLIQQLRCNERQPPAEGHGGDGSSVAALQAALREKDAEILQLREELEAAAHKQDDTVAQIPAKPLRIAPREALDGKCEEQKEQRETRASVSSQASSGFPSVLDSSEISTENGRASRFPRPELEISFSPLQPNRMALRRQGEESAVTVKISRPAAPRKRKSGEMEKDEVEAQNKRNTRSRVTAKPTWQQQQQESSASPAARHDSQSSMHSRKEGGALQKIGDFLQSSPTLLGSKAKKMISLVSGRGGNVGDAHQLPSSPYSSSSSSSLSLRAKKSKRKLYRPEISSPMDVPPHPIISREPEEKKESDHLIIKRRLRSRTAK
ncbi:kinesin-like protein KIF20B isoform X2 [Nelusetta ayraudi]|uniref:kinesin-like protein KIF20B isoform X2 n=1 Tax=Nelusetta ayraudi TaxID=303726 RepID=UPI003F710E68